MIRMRDDERRLLAALAAGETPEVATSLLAMCPQRGDYLLRKWARVGWYDAAAGSLTLAGAAFAARHRILQEAGGGSQESAETPSADADGSGGRIHDEDADDIDTIDDAPNGSAG